jgi:hypothetical protein
MTKTQLAYTLYGKYSLRKYLIDTYGYGDLETNTDYEFICKCCEMIIDKDIPIETRSVKFMQLVKRLNEFMVDSQRMRGSVGFKIKDWKSYRRSFNLEELLNSF